MLIIDTKTFAEVTRLSAGAVSSHLSGLPFTEGRWAMRQFDLVDVLPRLDSARLRAKTPDLFAVAEASEDHLFVGDGAVQKARKLWAWMAPPMRDRYQICQTLFTVSLAETFACGDMMEHVAGLQWKLLCHPAVLRWVVTGTHKHELPADWQAFASAFALVNASADFDPQTLFDEVA